MTDQRNETYQPPIEQRANDVLYLSTIVNKFMETKRATLRDNREETVGEHTLHLQFIAVSYAAEYHPELDIGKVAHYALIHDFVEVYAGDVNTLNADPTAISKKALTEKLAFERLRTELGEMWPAFIEQIHQYEELEEPEARYVKCFDKSDAPISHYHSGGAALLKMGITSREEYEASVGRVGRRMLAYSDEFPDVVALREQLTKKVARRAFPTETA